MRETTIFDAILSPALNKVMPRAFALRGGSLSGDPSKKIKFNVFVAKRTFHFHAYLLA